VEPALCLAGFTISTLILSFCGTRSLGRGLIKGIVRNVMRFSVVLLLAGLVLPPAQATTVTEYLVPGNPGLWDLSVSSNGTVVAFTESASNNVAYLYLPENRIRQIPVPTPNSFPMGITFVPWDNATTSASAVFTESYGNKIGVMASNSTLKIAEYAVPTPGSGLRKIVYDRFRDVVWFTEYSAGKLGNFCFAVPSFGGRFGELFLPTGSNPIGIAIGTSLTAPALNRPYIWVADFGRKSIVRVYPETGACREYSVAPFSPWDVAVDPDGFVWFTGQKIGTDVSVIGRLDPVAHEQNKWALTLFSVPTPNSEVHDIEIDAKGNIWFTEFSDYASKIGRYSPLTNTFSEYQIITPTAKPQGLAIYTETGGTVNVWFTEYAGRRIGRIRQPEGPTVSTTWYSISSAVTTSSTVTTTYESRARSTGVFTVSRSTATATDTSAITASSTIVDTLTVVVTSPSYWITTYTYTTSTSWTTTTTTYTLTIGSVLTTSTTTSITATAVSTSWESVTTLTTATVISISWFSETTSTTATSTQVSTIFSPTVTVPTTTTTTGTATTVYSPTVTLTSTSLTETTTTTTSTTATTATSYSPTVTLTSTATSFTTFLPIRPCIVASAAYGSELAPEVQSLRMFRDWKVLSTFAGDQFMKVFNSFYYSFSPMLASTVASSPALTTLVRILLYPLIWILQISSMIFDTLTFAPELGMATAGLFAGALLGIVYIAPPVVGVRCLIKRKRDVRRTLMQALF